MVTNASPIFQTRDGHLAAALLANSVPADPVEPVTLYHTARGKHSVYRTADRHPDGASTLALQAFWDDPHKATALDEVLDRLMNHSDHAVRVEAGKLRELIPCAHMAFMKMGFAAARNLKTYTGHERLILKNCGRYKAVVLEKNPSVKTRRKFNIR